MSRTDILTEIKKAEAEADARVEKAKADKKARIAEASRDSVKRIQAAEAEMHSTYDSEMAKERESLDKMREEKLATGKQESTSIEASSKKKIREVSDFLVNEFERTINVSS